MGKLVVLNAVPITNLAEMPGGAFDEDLGLSIVGSFSVVSMAYNEVGFDGWLYEPGSIPDNHMALLENHDHGRQVGVLRSENGIYEGAEVSFGYGAFHDTNDGRDGLVKARNNHRLGIQQTSVAAFIEQSRDGEAINEDLRGKGVGRVVEMTDPLETSLVMRGNIPGTRTITVNSSLPVEIQLSQVREGMTEIARRLTEDNHRELLEQLAHELSEHSASIASALNEAGRPQDAGQVQVATKAANMPQDLVLAMIQQADVGATVRSQLEGLV